MATNIEIARLRIIYVGIVLKGVEITELTEKQKNCPYCHPGSDLKANFGVAWEGNALAFDNVDSPQVMSGGPYSGDITFDLDTNQLISYGESTDPTTIDILYCPMCGRPLGGNEDD